jgi:S1-C subfamily serine protease
LEPGDVITALDGESIRRGTSLMDLLFRHQPGDVVTLTVERDGAVKTFDVTLGERPDFTD